MINFIIWLIVGGVLGWIASLIMRHLDASPAIQSRKEIIRHYAWPAVFRNFIAPLLTESHNPLRS